jgi:two-component system NarL family sensor kinase
MGFDVVAARPDIRAAPAPPASVARAVLQFVLAGLVAVVALVVGSLLVLRELGRREAVRDAREFAVLAGQGIVEPILASGLLARDPDAVARVDQVVQERVLGERVARVKIWSSDGRIVYSDEPRLIGARYPLGGDERAALAAGRTEAELSDLAKPENRFERGQGDLYEVYTRLRTPDGTPLLFETYQRGSSLVARGRDVSLPFAVPVLGGLVLLWLVQVPLAWRLASRLRRSQLEREALLLHAVEASADERRRIAADLHDGVVQDLAGLSYSLSAVAERAPERTPPAIVNTVTEAAAALRGAIRQLRTLLVEIHPPNLRSAGLEAALRDLLAPLSARGVTTRLDVPEDPGLDRETEQLLFRAAGEAIRNVQRHAAPTTVEVEVSRADVLVRLEVSDDGAGFAAADRERRRAEGHVGLTLLEELVARRGGRLDVRSSPGVGTSFELEVPTP